MKSVIQKASVLVLVIIPLLMGNSNNRAGEGLDRQLGNSFRRPPVNGWTLVHLEGKPREIGFQHGYWLAAEIVDMQAVAELELKHDTGKEWSFFPSLGTFDDVASY